jgi:UDP-N-acetylmuramyl pentapeptide synthase
MKYLLSLARPRVAIICDITQRYLEGFSDLDELIEEYEYLAGYVREKDLLILNYDNLKVRELAGKAKAEIYLFGLGSNETPNNNGLNFWSANIIGKEKGLQKINIQHGAGQQEYSIERPGDHHVYALLASLIVEEKMTQIKND